MKTEDKVNKLITELEEDILSLEATKLKLSGSIVQAQEVIKGIDTEIAMATETLTKLKSI